MTQPQHRNDPDRKRRQVRAANRARSRAVEILIKENQQRFDALYARLAAAEGVQAVGRNRRTRPDLTEAEVLQRRLARLQVQLDEAQAGEAAGGQT